MDGKGARNLVQEVLQEGNYTLDMGKEWKDPKHIATNEIRDSAKKKLTVDKDVIVIAVEIYLNKELPLIKHFEGIIDINDLGIWYYDGDGHVNDPPFRQYLIPWHCVDQIRVHTAT